MIKLVQKMFLFLFIWIQFKIFGLNGLCVSRSLYASLSKSYVSVLHYSNNEDCSYTIRPLSLYASGYYLEIKWLKFQVEGKMPICKDYIDIKLTRSSVSIGKFCSDNVGSSTLFDMYSSDAYATIRFKSDASLTRGGIQFSYQLKSIYSRYLGEYTFNRCSHSPRLITRSGVFYSDGWPRGYTGATGSYCYLRLDVGSSSATKIVVMDGNLKSSYCNERNDYLDIKQSSFLYTTSTNVKTYSSSITGKLCGSFSPRSITSTKRYVYMYFNKPHGSLLSRGFIVGYIAYTVSPSSISRRRVVDLSRRRVLDLTRRRVQRVSRRRIKGKSNLSVIMGATFGALLVIVLVASLCCPSCNGVASCLCSIAECFFC